MKRAALVAPQRTTALVASTSACHVVRRQLLARFIQAGRRRCLILQGPAGSGKTTALSMWRPELMRTGVEVAWVACRPDGEEDFARFSRRLLAALEEADRSLVGEAALVAGQGFDAETIERMIIALVRGIAAQGRDITIVFDAAEELRDAGVLLALQLLLDYAPPNLQCVFASRNPLPLSLSRLRAQDQLVELGFAELRFQASESGEFLRATLGEISELEVHRFHALTHGWAAGLQLLCGDPRTRQGKARAASAQENNAGAIASYFDQQVLWRLSHEELRFLVCCAVPDRFCALQASHLIGAPSSLAQCVELLEWLQAEDLFIMPDGDTDGWWRMQPLLRKVLLDRFDDLPEDERRQVHRAAWQWLAEQHLAYEAVRHAVAADEAQVAAELAEEAALQFFARGDVRGLVRMLKELPASLLRRRDDLRLWLAWLEIHERRYDDCKVSIERLRHELVDGAARCRLTLLQGLLAMHTDDVEGLTAILPELLALPANADGIATGGRRNLLTWLYLHRGNHDRALRVQLDEATPLVDGKVLYGTAFGTLMGRCLVGLTHAVGGRILQAERIYRDVLHEASRRGMSRGDAAGAAAALLGEVAYELNDPSGADRLLEDRIDLVERVAIPDIVLRAFLALARSRCLAGRRLEAFGFIERLEAFAERHGLPRLLAYSLLEQVQHHLHRHDPAQANACMTRLAELEGHPAPEVDSFSEISLASDRARILLAIYSGDLKTALNRMDYLLAACRKRGFMRRVAVLHMQLAALERQLGRGARSIAQLREALRLGHQLGLVRSLLDAHPAAPVLIDDALRSGYLDDIRAFYAEGLQSAAGNSASDKEESMPEHEAQDATGAIESLLNEREVGIVSLLMHGMPNKKIARALGLSPETIKWHLRKIYAKLGASGREEVVERLRAEAEGARTAGVPGSEVGV